jgi:hypothetical protein
MCGSARAQIWRYQPPMSPTAALHPESELSLVTAGTGSFGWLGDHLGESRRAALVVAGTRSRALASDERFRISTCSSSASSPAFSDGIDRIPCRASGRREERARRAAEGFSPTELSRTFRKDMGLTLCDFRSRVRLLKFVQVVDGGDGMLRSAPRGIWQLLVVPPGVLRDLRLWTARFFSRSPSSDERRLLAMGAPLERAHFSSG